jgi:hypothetical protein
LGDPELFFQEPDQFQAAVTYTDQDSHLPWMRCIVVNEQFYPLTACLKDYSSGALFEGSLTITETGWYRYYFEFSDGLASVTTPLDSLYVDLRPFVPGDADGNGIVNVSDVVYLIAYIFGGGPGPDPLEAGDADCNDIVNISDAVYLIAYIFGGGPPPCDPS